VPISILQAFAVRHHHTTSEMLNLSKALVGSIIASLPLFVYLMLGLTSYRMTMLNTIGTLCEFDTGAYYQENARVIGKLVRINKWRNCSFASWDYWNTEDAPTIPHPTLMTLREVLLQKALTKDSTVFAASQSGLFQTIEVSLMFLVSTLLLRVRQKSVKDIFGLQITMSELSLCVITVVRLGAVAILSGLSAEYATLVVFINRFKILTVVWTVAMILTFLNVMWLVYRTLRSFDQHQKSTKVLPANSEDDTGGDSSSSSSKKRGKRLHVKEWQIN